MDGIVENGAGEIRKRAFLMHPHIIVNTQEYNPPPPVFQENHISPTILSKI